MFTADCERGLDKGCEVKWREGKGRKYGYSETFVENLDDESEGKTI